MDINQMINVMLRFFIQTVPVTKVAYVSHKTPCLTKFNNKVAVAVYFLRLPYPQQRFGSRGRETEQQTPKKKLGLLYPKQLYLLMANDNERVHDNLEPLFPV